MLKLVLPILILIIIAVFFGSVSNKAKSKKKRGPILAKQPLSPNEQQMYFRLTGTFPEHVVLAQVAFSAIVTRKVKHWSERSDFNRLYADFVLCTKAFKIVAVIELDDKSHEGKERHDAERDALLAQAGYHVLRYKTIPNENTLLTDTHRLFENVAGTVNQPKAIQTPTRGK